jgi:hypothetical protein
MNECNSITFPIDVKIEVKQAKVIEPAQAIYPTSYLPGFYFLLFTFYFLL